MKVIQASLSFFQVGIFFSLKSSENLLKDSFKFLLALSQFLLWWIIRLDILLNLFILCLTISISLSVPSSIDVHSHSWFGSISLLRRILVVCKFLLRILFLFFNVICHRLTMIFAAFHYLILLLAWSQISDTILYGWNAHMVWLFWNPLRCIGGSLRSILRLPCISLQLRLLVIATL